MNGDVILPCSFRFNPSSDFPTVEWSKKGLQPDVIFLYRDGCETYEMKNPAFEYRTSLIMKELKNGNISLRISNVQLSDAGTYRCMRLWQNAPWETTTVELTVGTSSQVFFLKRFCSCSSLSPKTSLFLTWSASNLNPVKNAQQQ